MRGWWRDRDLVLVGGCLLVGLLHVRAQRRMLRALTAESARDEQAHRRHQPMKYDHPLLRDVLEHGTLATAFGMN